MGKSSQVLVLATAIGALLLATAALSAPANPTSSLPRAVVEAKKEGAAVDGKLVAGNNAFGLSLFKTLVAATPGNVAISPLSVALALQIVYNGAAGMTQQAMSQTLRLGNLTTPQINLANAALQASLLNPDPQVQLTIANSLWMHVSRNPVLPSFSETNRIYYSSTVGDLAGAPASVDAWVARETNGLIKQIMPPQPAGHYDAVAAVIANVIYFKGRWSRPFEPGRTHSAPFTLSNGSQIPCHMMHQTDRYQYVQSADWQAIRLPYGEGRLSMLIVLPNTGVSLNRLIADLNADNLNGWIAQLKWSYGTVALPRFTADYRAALPGALTSLGMGIAFAAQSADFSGIAPSTVLSDVEHKAIVIVDEIGTVAAAATSAETMLTSAPPPPEFTMTMDRPFFYAIRDDKTEQLLFVGALARPH